RRATAASSLGALSYRWRGGASNARRDPTPSRAQEALAARAAAVAAGPWWCRHRGGRWGRASRRGVRTGRLDGNSNRCSLFWVACSFILALWGWAGATERDTRAPDGPFKRCRERKLTIFRQF